MADSIFLLQMMRPIRLKRRGSLVGVMMALIMKMLGKGM